MNNPLNPLATAEPWNLVASGYTTDGLWIMEPFSRKAMELARLSKKAEVIDVAAGPGTLSIPLASKVASIQALDFSKEMLVQLQNRASAKNIHNIHLIQGDGQELPTAANRFDAAFSLFGLMFFPNRKKGFAELYRVLKPGGITVVSSWAPWTESSLFMNISSALQAADPAILTPQANFNSLENPQLFLQEMQEAGFKNVSIQPYTVTLSATASELWQRMTTGGVPLVMLRKKLGEEQWKIHSEKALQYLEQKFQGQPQQLSVTAYIGMGKK